MPPALPPKLQIRRRISSRQHARLPSSSRTATRRSAQHARTHSNRYTPTARELIDCTPPCSDPCPRRLHTPLSLARRLLPLSRATARRARPTPRPSVASSSRARIISPGTAALRFSAPMASGRGSQLAVAAPLLVSRCPPPCYALRRNLSPSLLGRGHAGRLQSAPFLEALPRLRPTLQALSALLLAVCARSPVDSRRPPLLRRSHRPCGRHAARVYPGGFAALPPA